MERTKTYDVFITHAWRFHADWTKLTELLDQMPGLSWRNFSLPWHDPAISPNTEMGGKFIRDCLESQIVPSQVVVLLAGVYEIRSAKYWIEMEIEMARKYQKPIVGVPAINKETIPDEIYSVCDAIANWNGPHLLKNIDKVLDNSIHYTPASKI